MKRGFTILELLVASLLLAMLVTMLTMMFNQSSIAWNTGVASVSDLEEVRAKLGGYHDIADDVLPGIGSGSGRSVDYRTVSLFRNWNGNGSPDRTRVSSMSRAFDKIEWENGGYNLTQFNFQNAEQGAVLRNLGKGTRHNKGNGGYIVGVRSAGPNGKMGDDDDITTYPEKVN